MLITTNNLLIMYVVRKLRLNRFQAVPCLSAKQLYKKYGLSEPALTSKQTADAIDETVPIGTSKTKLLQLGKDIAEKAMEFKSSPQTTAPMERVDPR